MHVCKYGLCCTVFVFSHLFDAGAQRYAQTLIVVAFIVVNLFSLFNFTRNGSLRFDHLWTQDSPMFRLTVGGKTGPYIDQGGSTLKV